MANKITVGESESDLSVTVCPETGLACSACPSWIEEICLLGRLKAAPRVPGVDGAPERSSAAARSGGNPPAVAVPDALLAAAYHQGRRAGQMLLSSSLNAFVEGSPEAAEWARGWRSAVDERNPNKARK